MNIDHQSLPCMFLIKFSKIIDELMFRRIESCCMRQHNMLVFCTRGVFETSHEVFEFYLVIWNHHIRTLAYTCILCSFPRYISPCLRQELVSEQAKNQTRFTMDPLMMSMHYVLEVVDRRPKRYCLESMSICSRQKVRQINC